MSTRALVVSAVALFAAGCGGGKATVKGSVSAGGKPVVWGTVILVDASGAYHQGDIELNGTFEIPGVPSGAVKIGVTSPNPEDPRAGGRGKDARGGKDGANKGGGKGGPVSGIDDPRSKFVAENGGPALPRPAPPAGAWFPLPNPDKTGDPMQSGLTGEIKSGQPLDIAIK